MADFLTLRWYGYEKFVVSSFKDLRDEKSFTDVTLACDGQTLKAHKMVLAASSDYLKKNLEKIEDSENDDENDETIIFVKIQGVSFKHLAAIVEFMYTGEAPLTFEDKVPMQKLIHLFELKWAYIVEKSEKSRNRVKLSIISEKYPTIDFKMKSSTKFSKLISLYSQKFKVSESNIELFFQGEKIDPDQTPGDYDMDNVLEARLKFAVLKNSETFETVEVRPIIDMD